MLLREIENAAEAAYPRESCGLLIGLARAGGSIEVTEVASSPNVAARPRRRFEVDSQVRFDAERRLRGRPERVIGHFHSHPEEAPRPSAADRERVYETDLVWVITSVKDGRAERTTAHLFDAKGGVFREITLTRAAEEGAPRRRQGC